MGSRFGKYGDAKYNSQLRKKLPEEKKSSLTNYARSARTSRISYQKVLK